MPLMLQLMLPLWLMLKASATPSEKKSRLKQHGQLFLAPPHPPVYALALRTLRPQFYSIASCSSRVTRRTENFALTPDTSRVPRYTKKLRTSHVTRHTSHVTRHTSHVTSHTSHVTRHTSHVTRHTSHVTRHTSHVTRHTSHVTRHTSHIVCLALILEKWRREEEAMALRTRSRLQQSPSSSSAASTPPPPPPPPPPSSFSHAHQVIVRCRPFNAQVTRDSSIMSLKPSTLNPKP